MAESKTETENRNESVGAGGFDAMESWNRQPIRSLADDANWTIVGDSDAANTCIPTRRRSSAR